MSFAQYGISVGYKHLGASNWENLVANYNLGANTNFSPIQEGTNFAFDYSFRLKKKRIEFHPEISYSRFIRDWKFEDESYSVDMKSNFFNLSFHTNIYPLDFAGDCNCPTFSKDGSFFEKGFFIQISPTASLINNTFKDTERKIDSSDLAFGIGIGTGIDFGLSDFITISPIFRYSYLFGAEWDDLDQHLKIDSADFSDKNTTNISTIYLGLRLGFRFDELNKYGYR